ncbi:ABC transporter ATP-binding protein [Cohnella lupini]|uniref:Teichoic acid transport system ATP-binding protein n=1 Tax=Cohnella lupini TaxID=1294267 RepID=A0A3D9I7H0_9BACL|nr:ABC transporter ATP-binding protein [Cohnella lupini]RED57641.1 teichoic acid transport system ATP-binding protein [Cohnella lupini]
MMTGYKAQLQLLQQEQPHKYSQGIMCSTKLLVTNIGDLVWYAYDNNQPVLVGYHYRTTSGELKEGIRTKLPYNISPGESITINAAFIVPSKSNSTELVWDLVLEGVSWFAESGSMTLSMSLSDHESGETSELDKSIYAISCSRISKKFKIYSHNSSKLAEYLSLGMKKNHQDYWALKNISFAVKKGETYGIIGFNGSGKSTLLSILAQTKHPTNGEFLVQGRIAALLELGAGFHPELTGRQNVIYNSYLYGIPGHEIEEKLDSIQEFSGIGMFFDKAVKSYSSGMYVRLAFSLAIHVDPDVLIIDEALAVGDEVFQRKCYAKFEEFKAKGKTIILVTHDLNAVRALCDRVGIIYDGTLIFEGTSNDVVNYYQKMSLTANMQVAVQHETKEDELRYGNGKAKIIEYKLLDQNDDPSIVYKTGEKIKVTIRAEIIEHLENPVIGVIFKTINGVEVFGTNSKILGSESRDLKGGRILTCDMTIPIHLNEGTYFMSFGVSNQIGGETITVDRMVDVTFIRVISDIPCIGLVNQNIGAGVKLYAE